jgi:hypothetical protein
MKISRKDASREEIFLFFAALREILCRAGAYQGAKATGI